MITKTEVYMIQVGVESVPEHLGPELKKLPAGCECAGGTVTGGILQLKFSRQVAVPGQCEGAS
ncbi:MAG: hypothetical protein WC455_15600 [Dehalococcoidia bacterium]|jgi:hypothetical protein